MPKQKRYNRRKRLAVGIHTLPILQYSFSVYFTYCATAEIKTKFIDSKPEFVLQYYFSFISTVRPPLNRHVATMGQGAVAPQMNALPPPLSQKNVPLAIFSTH